MRIVIDLQGAQGASRDRGIGRYTMSLAKAIVSNRGNHEVIIALNGLFTESIEPIRAAFAGLLSSENIKVWQAVGPVHPLDSKNIWRRQTAELLREEFLASLQPDVLHITSIFEGFVDDAIHSIGKLPGNIFTAVTVYDLIPLIQSSEYLDTNENYKQFYREKLKHLTHANLFLSISESSRREVIEHLAIEPKYVVNISAAADSHFQPIKVSEHSKKALFKRFGITSPFLMYSGATDERKNHLRLIKAFSILKPELKKSLQLVLVGGLPDSDRQRFVDHTKKCGIEVGKIIITGKVTDEEMVCLYNLCALFVFPSWHEGFGLPALEAMSCGAPAIGSNNTSVPEVLGLDEALFDPFSEESIAKKIETVLSDEVLRLRLASHGLAKSKEFSWDETAKRAIFAFESAQKQKHSNALLKLQPADKKQKLAMFSPAPPEKSGISTYTAELLPALSEFYDIDLIVTQKLVSDDWIVKNINIQTPEWFLENQHLFDRIVYQFGNSPFHQHMFDLLLTAPGVVVLHDFYLSSIVAHIDVQGINPNFWSRQLYSAYGYQAVIERTFSTDSTNEIIKYPCNKSVIDEALGVIVHSESSRRLARKWYGDTEASDWARVPLLRVYEENIERQLTRDSLDISQNSFVVCSFGLLDPTKQNQRLLDAWLSSSLSRRSNCSLIFVGENHGGDYGNTLVNTIENSGRDNQIKITGWTENTEYRQYLAAADVAVQLRTLSRGETSAAVLDCMNFGIPTIVNANGSMADIPSNVVWMLEDEFNDSDLVNALEELYSNQTRRDSLGSAARALIFERHSPSYCASQYHRHIESFYQQASIGKAGLINKIGTLTEFASEELDILKLAQAISQNNSKNSVKQLLIDVSAIVKNDHGTGIERVVRGILTNLFSNPPDGFRIEPVYATESEDSYRYARKFALEFLDCPGNILEDDVVEVSAGDIFLGLDLHQYIITKQASYYKKLQELGAKVYFVVYDLLPVLHPEVFPEGVESVHRAWIKTIEKSDGLICISNAVLEELTEWLCIFGLTRFQPLKLGWFHLGADVANSSPSLGLPPNSDQVFHKISTSPTFLMVGTIEPRKGHIQTIQAFETLWSLGHDVNLVIVGSEGWKGLPDNKRRTIPKIVDMLLKHPELTKRLFWLTNISDEYLEGIYARSNCLIAPSQGEGFGLPLIEAAQHGMQVIARDIPVFREVAGPFASYFSGDDPTDISDHLINWLSLNGTSKKPNLNSIPWLTWAQSTSELLKIIIDSKWVTQWQSDYGRRFLGNDLRLGSEVGLREGSSILSNKKSGYLIYGPYISMGPGKYKVRIKGFSDVSRSDGAYIELTVDDGAKILAKSALRANSENGYIKIFEIILQEAQVGIEIRVWICKNTIAQISLIEIIPIGSEFLILEND